MNNQPLRQLLDSTLKDNANYQKEIERLNSIIKEVREYIKNNDTTFKVNEVVNAFGIPSIEFTIEPWKKDILEILDKEKE